MKEKEVNQMYNKYVKRTKKEPDTAYCRILWSDGEVYESVAVSLLQERRDDDESVFFYCDGMEELLNCLEKGGDKEWKIDKVLSFDNLLPERRSIWMRLGVTVTGTAEEMEKVLAGDWETVFKLIEKGQYDVDGESYIPAECVEEYNQEYGTNHPYEDIY